MFVNTFRICARTCAAAACPVKPQRCIAHLHANKLAKSRAQLSTAVHATQSGVVNIMACSLTDALQ